MGATVVDFHTSVKVEGIFLHIPTAVVLVSVPFQLQPIAPQKKADVKSGTSDKFISDMELEAEEEPSESESLLEVEVDNAEVCAASWTQGLASRHSTVHAGSNRKQFGVRRSGVHSTSGGN